MSRYCILIIILLSPPVFSAHLMDDINLPLTKESAAQLVKIESDGKVLSIEKKIMKDKAVFQAKVLHDNGKMKMYLIDPETGHSPH